MALKLWLPLISDNKNQGISNYTPTGSPASWGNGPIGGAATFNNNAAQRITTYTTELNFINDDFSWCCWFNKDSSSLGTDRDMWAFTNGRADAGGRGYGLCVYQKSNGHSKIICAFGTQKLYISNVNDNEWHHIAFTRKGTTIKIYLDGILNTNTTFSGTLPTYAESTGIVLGCFSYTGGNIYPLIGSVCDFRIYNNTLSDREVREIANGLLIHYKLDGVGNFGNKNLLTWNVEYSKANPLVHSGSSQDAIKYLGDASLVTLTPGKDYYISVHTDAVPGTHNTSGSTLSKRDTFTIFLYLRNQGTSKAVGGYDSAPNLNKDNIYINDPQNNTYVWKYTAPSNAQDITLRTNLYSDGSTSISHKFWDFKVEEGSYTGFTPGVNQPQYAKLGFGSTKIKDCSGYNRDGTINGTLTTENNTARYNTSIGMTNGSCIYLIPDPIKSTTKEFTISLWFNSSSIGTQQCIWNGRTEVGKAIAIFLIDGKLRIDDDNQTTISNSLSSNVWYHLAVTWKAGGNKITYLNGTQVSSVAVSSTLSKSNTRGSLGRSSTDWLMDSNYYYGKMSDFRIYGVALPASEILRLAKIPTSICNNGTLITEEVTESQTSNVAICRSGISNGICVSELPGKYDTTLHIEPDGSAWVRMVHHEDPTTYKFASSDTFITGVYKDSRRFFYAGMCDLVDKWEFMVIQRALNTSPTYKFRWIQPINPNVAVYEDIPASAITKNTSDGYTSFSTGGIYKFNSSTFYCTNNGSKGNWWGAIGAWAEHQGGIPAWNGTVVKDGGYIDLYIRVDNVIWTSNKRTLCSFDRGSKGILASEFVEY